MENFQQKPGNQQNPVDKRLLIVLILLCSFCLLGVYLTFFNTARDNSNDELAVQFVRIPLTSAEIEGFILNGFPSLQSIYGQQTTGGKKGLTATYANYFASLLQNTAKFLKSFAKLNDIQGQLQSKKFLYHKCIENQRRIREELGETQQNISNIIQQKRLRDIRNWSIEDTRKELKQVQDARRKLIQQKEDILSKIETIDYQIQQQKKFIASAETPLLEERLQALKNEAVQLKAKIELLEEQLRQIDLHSQPLDNSDYQKDQEMANQNTQLRKEFIKTLQYQIMNLRQEIQSFGHSLQSKSGQDEDIRKLLEKKREELKSKEYQLERIHQFEQSSSDSHKRGLSAPETRKQQQLRAEKELELIEAETRLRETDRDIFMVEQKILRANGLVKELENLKHQREILEVELNTIIIRIKKLDDDIAVLSGNLNEQNLPQPSNSDYDRELRRLNKLIEDLNTQLQESICLHLQFEIDTSKDLTQRLASEGVGAVRNIKRDKFQIIQSLDSMTSPSHSD